MMIRRITSIEIETPSIRTLRFDAIADASPGQFVMVWIPGVDEIPMSLSYLGSSAGFTVARVGHATQCLHALNVQDKIGIRGPFGRGYHLENAKKILVLGGGCGSAPLGPILDMANQFDQVRYVVGARTTTELLFVDRALKQGIEVSIYTDDGSGGECGLVTDPLAKLLSSMAYDLVVACGPEAMLKEAVDICCENRTPIQVALERYMRCGVGLCDSCSIDGLRVCKDGPVFTGGTLINLPEFGAYNRNATGRRKPL